MVGEWFQGFGDIPGVSYATPAEIDRRIERLRNHLRTNTKSYGRLGGLGRFRLLGMAAIDSSDSNR